MRTAATILLILALPLAAFGWWGTQTQAGHSAYDEMAGIVPFAAEALSALLLIVSAICAWVARRRAR